MEAYFDGRLNGLRFSPKGEHPDKGTGVYEWFNVERYIEKCSCPLAATANYSDDCLL